jgi:hypothetical protein
LHTVIATSHQVITAIPARFVEKTQHRIAMTQRNRSGHNTAGR